MDLSQESKNARSARYDGDRTPAFSQLLPQIWIVSVFVVGPSIFVFDRRVAYRLLPAARRTFRTCTCTDDGETSMRFVPSSQDFSRYLCTLAHRFPENFTSEEGAGEPHHISLQHHDAICLSRWKHFSLCRVPAGTPNPPSAQTAEGALSMGVCLSISWDAS
jgi:hypothetical protein